jgi:hypothetical protein
MKSAAIPAVRVPPELRQAAEDVLQAGETLSGFVAEAVRRNVEFRQTQKAFVERPPRRLRRASPANAHPPPRYSASFSAASTKARATTKTAA